MSDAPATPTAPEDPIAHARNSMMYWHERAMTAESHRDELANTLRALVDYCRASAEEGYDPFAADALLDMADAALARFKEGKR